MRYLQASFVFDPVPKLMRTYERIGNDILSKDGSNISSVLYSLSKGDEASNESLDRLLGWIRQVPEEPFDEFKFVTTELNDVIFGMKASNKDSFIDARLLSDGTLRSLAVLTAIETVKPNSRVVIEEFDNGLHPSRARVLLEAMSDCCKRKELNLLVTTHNPATLNSLREEEYDGVVICAWDSAEECFNLIELCDLPRHDELLERGRLGDLITQQVINQYLVPKYGDKHKEKSLEWLRNLP
jgi:predicted ATPase